MISSKDREPRGIIPLENLQVRDVQDARRKVILNNVMFLNSTVGAESWIVYKLHLCSLQYCFEIYAADNSSGLIKACKTDSEGKVVEGNLTRQILVNCC